MPKISLQNIKTKRFTEDNLIESLNYLQVKYGFKYRDPIITKHECHKLTNNQKAIYAFCYKDTALKIGLVTTNSNARLNYQHYNPDSCKSNLAKQIKDNKDCIEELKNCSDEKIKDWLKDKCLRYVIVYDEIDIFALKLIEAKLHFEYQPIFENNYIKTLLKNSLGK